MATKNVTAKLPEGYTMQSCLEESILILTNLTNSINRYEKGFGFTARKKRDYWMKVSKEFTEQFPIISVEIDTENP